MIKSLRKAAGLAVAVLALGTTSAHAQVTINVGTPAPRYVVVEKAHPVKRKHPKYKSGAVMLVPAGPTYYAPRSNNGRGRGKGRH